MTKFLPVVEKFHSLQGEGFHCGKSAFFIRLAGCEVGCPWCDTKHSWDSKKYPLLSVETLLSEIQEVRSKGASFIVLTGGEPLQHNLDNLCQIIKNRTYIKGSSSINIHIETSGVNNFSGFYDWITLSPKRHNPPQNYFLEKCNEIKIIINDMRDIEFANNIKRKISILENEKKFRSEKKFFVQPAWKSKEGYKLAIEFAKRNPDWTLSLQTHKYLSIK
tara:strand:- start:1609 stop:2265 length:657 start_codon:yes stop_codon:yes gene_type:complete